MITLSVGIHNSWRQVVYAKAKAPGVRRIRRRQWIEFGNPSYAAPLKSVRKASRELALPRPTVWDVLHKRLKFKAYKLTLVQALTENDK